MQRMIRLAERLVPEGLAPPFQPNPIDSEFSSDGGQGSSQPGTRKVILSIAEDDVIDTNVAPGTGLEVTDLDLCLLTYEVLDVEPSGPHPVLIGPDRRA